MAVCLNPSLVPQRIDRHGGAASEVVPETKRMTNFVARYKANQLAHQFLVVVHLLCRFVDRTALYHIPVVYEAHHIVVPADMTLENLAASGVVNVRSVSILDGTCQVADATVARVLHAHG